MAKKPKNTDPSENIVEKTEYHHFTKKFTEKELQKKQKELSDILMEKFSHEQTIIKSKDAIKALEFKLRNASDAVTEGGEEMGAECKVKCYRDTNKKEYYYKGELVDTDDAEEEDFQLEIEQD